MQPLVIEPEEPAHLERLGVIVVVIIHPRTSADLALASLKRAFDKVDTQINAWIEQAQLTPKT